MIKNFYSALCLSLALMGGMGNSAVAQYLPPGTLDTTFSVDGKVMTSITNLDNESRAVAVQTDGKIVVAGNAKNGALDNFGLVRYNSDGTLDNAFGTAGKVTTSCGPGNNVARAIAIQADGKIVVAGNQENQTYSQFAVARYTTSGTLDNTFGSGGKVLTHLDYGFDLAYAVAIQSDGKIVAGGVSFDTLANGEFGIVRYNANGTLDNTFGTNGKIRTPLGTQWDQAQAIAIQTDGKIILAGRTATQMALVRYNTNGTLDATFGLGGVVSLSIIGLSEVINSIKLRPDGRILVGGIAQMGGPDFNYVLAQYDAAGNLDANFGLSGFFLADFGGVDILYALSVDANGSIVTAGSTGPSTATEFTVARYDSVGNMDLDFGGGNGFVTTSFTANPGAGANAVTLQADGKIVATGSALNGTVRNYVTARYFPQPVFVGVNEIGNTIALTIHPNPAKDFVIIALKNMMDNIEIADITGRVVYTYNYKVSSTKINTATWANGVYAVKVTSGADTFMQKLVVQH